MVDPLEAPRGHLRERWLHRLRRALRRPCMRPDAHDLGAPVDFTAANSRSDRHRRRCRSGSNGHQPKPADASPRNSSARCDRSTSSAARIFRRFGRATSSTRRRARTSRSMSSAGPVQSISQLLGGELGRVRRLTDLRVRRRSTDRRCERRRPAARVPTSTSSARSSAAVVRSLIGTRAHRVDTGPVSRPSSSCIRHTPGLVVAGQQSPARRERRHATAAAARSGG